MSPPAARWLGRPALLLGLLLVFALASPSVWANEPPGDYDRYAFDLVLAYADAGPLASRTQGQPVYAAADGELTSWWDASAGAYFLRHEAQTADGAWYFTTYIHLEPAVDVSQPAQRAVRQGQLLGRVAAAGQRGSGSVAHLHFGLLASTDPLCRQGQRTAVPLGDFIAGWSFPPTPGAVNQYVSQVVRQAGTPSPSPAVQAQAALTSTPTCTLTPSPAPTRTPPPPSATPTATPTSTPTPEPTATASPTPSPTATASPTATPSPTASPSPTATATPTPTPRPPLLPTFPAPGAWLGQQVPSFVLWLGAAGLVALVRSRGGRRSTEPPAAPPSGDLPAGPAPSPDPALGQAPSSVARVTKTPSAGS